MSGLSSRPTGTWPRRFAEGSFRTDLDHRINVVKLTPPLLAARKEDIPFLAQHFIDHFNKLQQKIRGLSHEGLSLLMAHDWPGNIRELENVIEHAFILCPSGLVQPQHLPEHLRPEYQPGPRPSPA